MHNGFEESGISLNHNGDRSLMRNRTISDVSETSPEFQFYKVFNFGKTSIRGGPKYHILSYRKSSQSKFSF